jgi:hypothetical protein
MIRPKARIPAPSAGARSLRSYRLDSINTSTRLAYYPGPSEGALDVRGSLRGCRSRSKAIVHWRPGPVQPEPNRIVNS